MYLLAVVLYNFLNQSLEGLIFMNERIRKLTELTLKGEMYAHPTKTALFLQSRGTLIHFATLRPYDLATLNFQFNLGCSP